MTYSIPSPQGFTPISTRYAQSNNFANDFLAGAAFKQQKDALKAQEARLNEFGAGLKGLKQGGDPNELMGRFPDQQKQIIQQLEFNKQQKLKEDYDALDKNDPMALKEFHNKYTDPKDAVGQQIASLKEEHKKSLALQGGQAYMRLLSGDSEGAIGGLKEYGELLKEKDPQMSAFIIDNTEKLKNMNADDQAVMLSGVVERLDPEILVRAKERAGIKKTESEAKETDAKTLATQGEELRAQVSELPAPVQKLVNDNVEASLTADADSKRTLDLASRIETGIASDSGGLLSKGWSALKTASGFEGTEEQLKTEYNVLRSKITMSNLPPGVATDKDVALAMSGTPGPDARPATLASFLRGVSKLRAYDSRLAQAKSIWFTENKHLGKAKGPIEIFGTKSKKDETFIEFSKRAGDAFTVPTGANNAPPPGSKVRKFNPTTGAFE
jgi:hypothetical protein